MASAALLAGTLGEAEETLEKLYDAQLLDIDGREPTGHARYRIHDLVRLVARERADADDTADEVARARMRAFGAWMYLIEAVHRRVFGGNHMIVQSHMPAWAVDDWILGAVTADPLKWFDRERLTFVALIHRAARDIQSQ